MVMPASSGGEEGRERAQRQQQSHTAQVPPAAVREGDVYVIGENGQPGAGRMALRGGCPVTSLMVKYTDFFIDIMPSSMTSLHGWEKLRHRPTVGAQY